MKFKVTPYLELMPLWQLLTMSMGRLHANLWVWNLALHPLLTDLISIVFTIEKMVKISIFIKKSAYKLVSFMFSHTDQVGRRVDEPFEQFRQYGALLSGQDGSKLTLKKAVFALISRLIHILNRFLH